MEMEKTLVVRTSGKPDWGHAIACGMMQTMAAQELAVVKTELEKAKAENEELKRTAKANEAEKAYRKKVRKMKRKCPLPRKLTMPEEVLLVGWAVTWLTIKAICGKVAELRR